MLRPAVTMLLGLAIPAAGGCGARHPSDVDVLALEVAPNTVACTGEAPRRCLLVRNAPDQKWTYFYDIIEGFTHEEGFRYQLSVDRQRVARPLADGSAYRYRLLRVISKEAAAPSK